MRSTAAMLMARRAIYSGWLAACFRPRQGVDGCEPCIQHACCSLHACSRYLHVRLTCSFVSPQGTANYLQPLLRLWEHDRRPATACGHASRTATKPVAGHGKTRTGIAPSSAAHPLPTCRWRCTPSLPGSPRTAWPSSPRAS